MSSYDRAQLASPLAFTESEFSWYIFETTGSRRYAGLVSIHRTGPRARSVELGLQLTSGRDLPRPLRDLVPSWLPILSPVRVSTDDRPLFMVALYDLDARAQPIVVEHEIEHRDFDATSFSARARDGDLELRAHASGRATIRARDERLALSLSVEPLKPPVVFGDGSPALHHGRIETHYVQRPRLRVAGELSLGGAVHAVQGEGVHDHQWLNVSTPNLKWIWPHLRLDDGRELTGYVIRDSSGGRDRDADDGAELGRAGWIIEADGAVRRLPTFDVHALAHVDTPRGRVPTSFSVEAPGFSFVIDHVVPAPYIRMRAFGDVIDGGTYEGPVEVRGRPEIRGWIEVMNAAHVRFSGRP